MIKLSKRLETVASFVPKGSNIADIGTDHGYIPIYLTERGIVNRALAMDVGTGPLERACAHIKACGLAERIVTRLGDGLKNLQAEEADCIVIAGMGGELIIRIMEEGRHMWDSVRTWVLSPQSDLDKVRRYLEEWEFLIDRETMLKEDGKYYTVMRVVRGTMSLKKMAYYKYGKLLIVEKNPVLEDYLAKEKRQYEMILSEVGQKDTRAARERGKELLQELTWIKEAEDEMLRINK